MIASPDGDFHLAADSLLTNSQMTNSQMTSSFLTTSKVTDSHLAEYSNARFNEGQQKIEDADDDVGESVSQIADKKNRICSEVDVHMQTRLT